MAIYRLLKNSQMEPEEVARLTAAYEQSLRALGLKDRNDPLTELVAKKIIKIGQSGVKDPAQICEIAVKSLGFP